MPLPPIAIAPPPSAAKLAETRMRLEDQQILLLLMQRYGWCSGTYPAATTAAEARNKDLINHFVCDLSLYSKIKLLA